MKKCVARIFRLNSKSTERQLASKTSAKGARNESRVNLEPLRVEELQRAEGAILQLVQSCAFPLQEPANDYTNQLLPQRIQLQLQEMAHPGLQHQPHEITTPQDV
ncbi:hypothetical protein P5673_018484 [Acropora cervicornis]|uniref:Uncharacterized protein n=1 Tax=Acropora cervicornis TaxID=6130 RepID=A0AAD9V2K9_ACRCE|nr:hypothetical protein P5673_018484 [Acropora cervicornis]